VEKLTKEEKIKCLEELLTKFKKRKPFLRILNSALIILITFTEASYIISLGNAFLLSSSIGIIIYLFCILIGIWLGVNFLRQFLNLDLVEKVLKNAIEEAKRGY
jgi:cytochrome c biogenesis factor